MTAASNLSFLVALGAGLLSFLSPCVLPLVPSYLSYLAGVSFTDLQARQHDARTRRVLLLNAACFIAGFSLVFMALGASFSLLGQFFAESMDWIRKGGGIVIVLFGLYVTGVFKIPVLMREWRLPVPARPAGYLGSALVGIAFAAGWTPCVGPILGAILFLAGTGETAGTGVLMLGAYSLGLGLPFFASALALTAFLGFYERFRTYLRVVEVAAGILLVVVGVLLYTSYITVLNGYLIALTPQWLWERL
jgi:cytochrome c-type biogenesis protein